MKRMVWRFGGVLSVVVLLAALSVSAVEIAPLPHRAIDQIEGSVPVAPPPPEGNGQAPPSPAAGGEGTAPGSQGVPPSQGGSPATVSTPLPPPVPSAGGEEPVVPPPPVPPVTAVPPSC